MEFHTYIRIFQPCLRYYRWYIDFPATLAWLVGSLSVLTLTELVGGWATPLKNISQLGWLFPIYGKIKNVPNHQPVTLTEEAIRGLLINSTAEKFKQSPSSSVWRFFWMLPRFPPPPQRKNGLRWLAKVITPNRSLCWFNLSMYNLLNHIPPRCYMLYT